MSHFETHDILTDSQYVFRKRCSCNTQLIVTINNLAKGLDKSEHTGPSRIFKSGPAEEVMECPKARDGGEHERGIFPLSLGGFGGLPREIF